MPTKPVPPKSSIPTPAPSATSAVAGVRYFEFHDDKSDKFWEITIAGLEVTVRYGRTGTQGQAQTKSFADTAAAAKHANKLIDEKTAKGYEEQKS